MPIAEVLQQARRHSMTPSSARRQSFALTEMKRRRMSMGYPGMGALEQVAPTIKKEESQNENDFIDSMEETFIVPDLEESPEVQGVELTAPHADEHHKSHKHKEWKSEFHEIMYQFTETKMFSGFILFIILLNTGMLIAQTWQVVSVRGGALPSDYA